jgi:hypothetical protein
MLFYTVLLHAHSIFRWLLLIFLIYTLIISFTKWQRSSTFNSSDIRAASLTVYLAHLQLLIGITLYFLSPKVMFTAETMMSPILRFFTVEHSSMMILAIACLTIGNASAKRTKNDSDKPKKIAIWFVIAFIIIALSIPWPFRNMGSGWL